jgi:hypothetical protein
MAQIEHTQGQAHVGNRPPPNGIYLKKQNPIGLCSVPESSHGSSGKPKGSSEEKEEEISPTVSSNKSLIII